MGAWEWGIIRHHALARAPTCHPAPTPLELALREAKEIIRVAEGVVAGSVSVTSRGSVPLRQPLQSRAPPAVVENTDSRSPPVQDTSIKVKFTPAIHDWPLQGLAMHNWYGETQPTQFPDYRAVHA
jgi:hypothetical protein